MKYLTQGKGISKTSSGTEYEFSIILFYSRVIKSDFPHKVIFMPSGGLMLQHYLQRLCSHLQDVLQATDTHPACLDADMFLILLICFISVYTI